ncbi:hypothetical protein EZV62_027448 [Acer yangbiense]|uniref:Reverse transcriptase zinc-binding domain-containing protein n=1 Tax=Acer yangbiense TaxID=1000413 RepID=A0A5C7GTP4_9ROSI|nr:hypothetical protein EZV62_027448 [Acer yangbiense]
MLFKRRIADSMFCNFCGEHAESSNHALWGCVHVKDLWGSCPFFDRLEKLHNIGFFDRLLWMDAAGNKEDVTIFIVAAWFFWFDRNQFLFGNKVVVKDNIWERDVAFVDKYNSTDVVSGVFPKTPAADRSVCWKAPPSGVFKLNVDAAVTHGSVKCGIGLIFRDVSELHCRPKKIVKREYWHQCRLPRNFNINLQEDALDRIISFSPVKIGMKTTILSTRFQHSWKNSRILYNGEINIYKGGRSCFQSPFRSNHPNPSTVRLKFIQTGVESCAHKWIEKSAEKKVEEWS